MERVPLRTFISTRSDENGVSRMSYPEFSFARPAWYALYTMPRHEKKVAQHLHVRNIEHYLPLYQAKRQWRDGSKPLLEFPLFPCYMFIRIARAERTSVLQVPGARAIVEGVGKEPGALPDHEIEVLRHGLLTMNPEPHPYLTVGQRGRILGGPLAGLEGIVVRTKSTCRVVLNVETIRKSVAVEVEHTSVELIDSAA